MSSSAAAPVPADSAEIYSSLYVVVPTQGICVMTERRTADIGGVKTDLVEFRSVKNLKAALLKPAARLDRLNIRPPVDAQTMQDILVAGFSKNKTDGGGMWHKREEAYKEILASGLAEDNVKALNMVLSKHRSPKWSQDNIGTDLPRDDEISVSYSERQIANKALDLLSEEVAHVTGMSESEARRTVLRAALVPGYAAKITLSGDKAAPPAMDAAQFKDIFGYAPGESGNGAAIKVDAIRPSSAAMYVSTPRVAQRSLMGSAGGIRRVVHATGTGFSARRTPHRAASVEKRDALAGVSAENKAVFLREEGKTLPKGPVRGVMMQAARILDARSFEIVARTDLRTSERQTMAQAASDMGMTVEEAATLRNDAAAKLVDALDKSGKRVLKSLRVAYTGEEPARSRTGRRSVKDRGPQVAEENRALFASEQPYAPEKGMTRGLFLTAARVLEPEAFRIVAQTALRRGGKLSMEQAAAAMGLPLQEAIDLRNRAMETLVKETGYDPDAPRAPSILKPYEVTPAFERAARVRPEPAPKADRAITPQQIEFVDDDEHMLVMISVPKAAMKGSFGLKINIDWNGAAEGAPEIVKAVGGIKSKPGAHAASGNAELEDPAIQPPPRTLDPS